MDLDTWFHIAIVASQTNGGELFINGISEDTTGNYNVVTNGAFELFGTVFSPPGEHSGIEMSGLLIYHDELTVTEINQLKDAT